MKECCFLHLDMQLLDKFRRIIKVEPPLARRPNEAVAFAAGWSALRAAQGGSTRQPCGKQARLRAAGKTWLTSMLSVRSETPNHRLKQPDL